MFAFGGAAGRFFDCMPTTGCQYDVDILDDQCGHIHVTVVEFILRVLVVHFPVCGEVRMLCAGLECFKFMPCRDKRLDAWCQRFDITLELANRVFDFVLSIRFPGVGVFVVVSVVANDEVR